MVSEPGSEFCALALANRSATLFHAKYYRFCLKDIDRSLASNYPAHLLYKLYARAGNAEQMLGHGDPAIINYEKCLEHLDQATIPDNEKKLL